MAKRIIKNIAVLGSGVMGSRIACHFAGIGVKVLLLDIAAEGDKNKTVNDALHAALKSNPSPVYDKNVVQRITTGNFDDDLKKIKECDWILEAVTERLDIKQSLYEKVEQHRKPATLITSNTSGIPLNMLAQGRSEDFKQHFCGTHFFNPPRYLRLLEVIPSVYTSREVIDFLLHYGDLFLGKTTVLAKDTPAFIANRIGVFSIMSIFHIMQQLSLSIDEVEALTGTVMGHAKSATFRTADIVGIDTFIKVANGVAQYCLDDEAREIFAVPAWLQKMLENKWLGDKSGQGFFKKTKLPVAQGSPEETKKDKEIHVLDLQSMEYNPRTKPKLATLEMANPVDDLDTRLKILFAGQDKAGEFYRSLFNSLFSYVSLRIPEIADNLYKIDEALKAGFGWELGAFENWDLFGVEKITVQMKEHGYKVAQWVDDMLAAGITHFYKKENGNRYYYDISTKNYKLIPGENVFIILNNYTDKIVWKNSHAFIYDIGDDVLALQWNTKMNSVGTETLDVINKGIALAEEKFKGLVITNEGPNFSAGANIGMIFMFAAEQEYDELDIAVRTFQQVTMRIRYSSIPVVTAPHGLSLGGGCEINLHADKICAAAESYMGLVELGVGLIPAGGGTKEFALRAADEMHEDEPETITLKNRFFNIATAKVSTSALEAYNIGILRKGLDEVVFNQQRKIAVAKRSVLDIYEDGYTTPAERKNIKVLGRSALGALYAGINAMQKAEYATAHDSLVARKLAYVMCGGDLSEPSFVSEQYLLDLEREAFLSLCGERKTLERLQSVLVKGKPIRN